MLRSVKDLENYSVSGLDGDIGEVGDFYFDDARWTIRYLVVETGGFWEAAQQVLISPISFQLADWTARRLALTREKIRNSPSAELDKPVSRQFEQSFYRYYDWPSYWGYGGIWGPAEFPAALAGSRWQEQPEEPTGDPHLRSVREVTGYHIKGVDEEIGHVKDFIVDDQSWTIRYLVVDTSNWWLGKSVLLSPRWIERISWTENLVHVKLPREIIRRSPEWKPEQPIDREYEVRLYEHYGWPAYWLDKTPNDPISSLNPRDRRTEYRSI